MPTMSGFSSSMRRTVRGTSSRSAAASMHHTSWLAASSIAAM
jgi:hypothetical protein